MPTRERNLIANVLGLTIALLLITIIFHIPVKFYWQNIREPKDWTETYDSIQVGMHINQVEKRYQSLGGYAATGRDTDRDRWSSEAPKTAIFYLYYRGPNAWQYHIYFDKNDKVVWKVRWWD